jgi:ABC-type bacteriocin/lantibiotic exporter with double-glycine peptidase domain
MARYIWPYRGSKTRSGSGKTTFWKLPHRLYDITEGQILIDGQNIAQVTQNSVRAQMALVPQEPIMFHRSLAENIAYGRRSATRQQIEEAAARLADAEGVQCVICEISSGTEVAKNQNVCWRGLRSMSLLPAIVQF